jgi:hypothetical protein
MPSPSNVVAQTSQQVLIERLSNLQADMTDIKGSIACFSGNLERLERLYLVEHEKLVGKVDAAFRRIDEQGARSDANTRRIEDITNQLIKLEKSIQPLVFSNKILAWIGVTLGGSVIALIWMVITHQVTLVFP